MKPVQAALASDDPTLIRRTPAGSGESKPPLGEGDYDPLLQATASRADSVSSPTISWCSVVPGRTAPGQRTSSGTRTPPS